MRTRTIKSSLNAISVEVLDFMSDLLSSNVLVWAGSRPKPRSAWLAISNGRFSVAGG